MTAATQVRLRVDEAALPPLWWWVLAALVAFAAYRLGRAELDAGALDDVRHRRAVEARQAAQVEHTRRVLLEQQRATAAAVQAAVRSARDDVGEVGRACAEVAETCALPVVWTELGVLPVAQP